MPRTMSLAVGPVGLVTLLSAGATGGMTMPNGVASGDTTSSSSVLWARSTAVGQVTFEWSTDATFGSGVMSATLDVTDPAAPVKTMIDGLDAGTRYHYRVTDSTGAAEQGSLVTAQAAGAKRGLRFGVSGDWRGELNPYPAINNAVSRNLDFFVALGDTVYADYPSPDVPAAQAASLAEFRAKHAEVYGPDRFGLGVNRWAELRAATSFYAMIDDHEVTNDFAGGARISSDARFTAAFPGDDPNDYISESTLYRNGLQAFGEFNPIQDRVWSGTGDDRTDGRPDLYRAQRYGDDAAYIQVDARSFRDEALPQLLDLTDSAAVDAFLMDSFDPTRTMLGEPQLDRLKADLLQAQDDGVTWKFVGISQPIQNFGPLNAQDRHEGYAAERSELLAFINDNDIENVVFIAADIHGTSVNNLTYQQSAFGPQIETGAFEITTGSVAFAAPFGPTVAELAVDFGILDDETFQFYDALPVAPDSDSLPDDKDDFLKAVIDLTLALDGYSRIGLQDSTMIDAELLQGDYFAVHTFGWTEFEIDAITQELLVTTYGIPFYDQAMLEADPSTILALEPVIVSQFVVRPIPAPGGAALAGLAALAAARRRTRA